jgi:hypothetical protein
MRGKLQQAHLSDEVLTKTEAINIIRLDFFRYSTDEQNEQGSGANKLIYLSKDIKANSDMCREAIEEHSEGRF